LIFALSGTQLLFDKRNCSSAATSYINKHKIYITEQEKELDKTTKQLRLSDRKRRIVE